MPTWPEHVQPASVEMKRTRNDFNLESPTTRKRQIVRRGRPMWSAEIEWRVRPKLVSETRYQLEQLNGVQGSVKVRDYGAAIVLTTGITVSSAAVASATNFSTTGWGISVANVLTAGQYVEVGGNLYLCSATTGSNGSGIAVCNTTTPLLTDLAVGDAVTLYNPGVNMRAAEPKWMGSRRVSDGLWSVRMSLVEDLNP